MTTTATLPKPRNLILVSDPRIQEIADVTLPNGEVLQTVPSTEASRFGYQFYGPTTLPEEMITVDCPCAAVI